MTDTPRCDQFNAELFSKTPCDVSTYHTMLGFARQLERELGHTHIELRRLNTVMDDEEHEALARLTKLATDNATLRRQVAALEQGVRCPNCDKLRLELWEARANLDATVAALESKKEPM